MITSLKCSSLRPLLNRTFGRRVHLISSTRFCATKSETKPSEDKVASDKAPNGSEDIAGTKTDVNDAYSKASKEYEELEGSVRDLHRQLLLKYANAENKRRERLDEIKKRDTQHISNFGEKTVAIYESLVKVCELAKEKSIAPDADDKVKSLSEGLVMTQGIMKNILTKHGIMKDSK